MLQCNQGSAACRRARPLGHQAIEQLTGPADERQALTVLLCAGPFAHEHEVRVGVAGPEDDLGAALGQAAAPTLQRPVPQLRERRGPLGPVGRDG